MQTRGRKSDEDIRAFRNEVYMYRQTRLLPITTYELVLRNAVVESALLHTRVLIDTLLDRDSRVDDDDLLLRDLAPTAYPQPLIDAIARLRTAYGTRKNPDSPCSILNKHVMHLTKACMSGFNFYAAVFQVLDPLVGAVLAEIGKLWPGLVPPGQEVVGIPPPASTSSSGGVGEVSSTSR